jgi:adenylate kinase
VVLLMGIAGSGKGTQGKLLGATRNYHVISTGELLRNYGSEDQHTRMHKGEILGDEEVTALLDKALSHLEDQNSTLLDGYPRTIRQAQWLLDGDKKDRFQVNYVLHLIASREAVKKRLENRARTDDHDAAIEARFNEYEEATLPILAYLRKEGVEVIEVNGEQAIEDVHQEIMAADYKYRHKD